MAIVFNGTTGAVTGITSQDELNVDSNTLVVDSTNNRVGIGTSSPSSDLHLSKSLSGTDTNGINIQNYGIYTWGIGIDNASSNVNLVFQSGGMGGTDRMRISNGGDVQFLNSGGNVRLYWDNSAEGLVSAGAGISFDGGSNYLDDYEEGTWTPAFVNGTVTYGNRSGVYTKVGGLVQASFMVQWSAISGLYEPRITLPFNATSSTNYRGTGAVGFMKGVDFGSSVNSSWITTANQGDVNLVLNYDNATPSFGNINDWSSSGEIQCTIVYRTNS